MPNMIATDIAEHIAKELNLNDEQADRIARVVQGRLEHHSMTRADAARGHNRETSHT